MIDKVKLFIELTLNEIELKIIKQIDMNKSQDYIDGIKEAIKIIEDEKKKALT